MAVVASWFEFAVTASYALICRGTRVNAASAASFNPHRFNSV